MTPMLNIRTLLAGLIALAVAVAPVAATVVASAAARTAAAAATHDCHGKAAQDHHQKAPDDTNKAGCPDCDSKHKSTCVGDGGKCCKLTGVLAALPAAIDHMATVDIAANPPTLIGWQVRPPPPPPRS
jgi:hypothetical protein